MLYLQQLALQSKPVRNAQPRKKPNPTITVARHPNAVTRWIRLKEMYMQLRGGTQTLAKGRLPHTTNWSKCEGSSR